MAVCAECQQPLEVTLPPDEDEDQDEDVDVENTTNNVVPDDVHLPCGCHFHWECLLSSYELDTCPHCATSIVSSLPNNSATEEQGIIVDMTNEGGTQHRIDILPLLKEESYLRAYPEERKCRAFLEFCREGDCGAVVDLLKSCSGGKQQQQMLDGDGDEEMDDEDDGDDAMENLKTADEVLRYQDPIGEMQSGLHAAAANGHREVAWLLLLLASELPEMEIPALVYQEAARYGVMRDEEQGAKIDIRGLRDAKGRTAEDVAKEVGVVWNGWIGNGRLAIP